jgi:hypothetical protein
MAEEHPWTGVFFASNQVSPGLSIIGVPTPNGFVRGNTGTAYAAVIAGPTAERKYFVAYVYKVFASRPSSLEKSR